MAGFTIEVTVAAGDLSFSLPFTNHGTFNATVYWGDTSNSTITTYDDADRTHTYASAGTYSVEIVGSAPGFAFQYGGDRAKCTDIITWGDSADFDGFQYMHQIFYGCAITSTGTGAILCDGATSLDHAFSSCANLAGDVQSNLLANCNTVENFDFLFYGSSYNTGDIPDFSGCTAMVSMDYAFKYASGMDGEIPDGCFANSPDLVSMYHAFFYTPALKYNRWSFFSSSDYDTRFLNKSVDFTGCFSRGTSLSTANGGIAPEFHKCDFGTETPTTTDCFSGNGNTETTLLNHNGIPSAWGGPTTISDPTLSGISDATLVDGQSTVVLTGNTICYELDDIKLGNASTYAACTVLESQTFTNTPTTEINATIGTVVQGDLPDDNAWVYVTHYRNQTNANGLAVTITAGASVPTSGAVNLTNGAQTISASGLTIPVSDSPALRNGPQTIAATGTSIPVGQAVNLSNGSQSIAATGAVIPVSESPSLQNAAQTLNASGVSIPVSSSVPLQNGAQTFYATGQVVALVPTSGDVILYNGAQTVAATGAVVPVAESPSLQNGAQTVVANGVVIPSDTSASLVNGAQTIAATGLTIPSSDTPDLQNGAQTVTATGVSIATSGAVSLENGAQTFYATGLVPVNYPTSTDVNLVNGAQTIEATGASIACDAGASLTNGAQTFYATGAVIPVAPQPSLVNGAQTIYATGRVGGFASPLKTISINSTTKTLLVNSDICTVQLNSRGS